MTLHGGWLGALRMLREPVPAEKKRLLRERWESLDPRWRFATQGLGQKATGCGATIGIHPRCDFDCTGCYLGGEANRVKPLPLEDAFRQLEELRSHLGPKGNVQITDGEVTLLPAGQLVAILLRARQLGLIPMVMSHGDTFRRRPGLLERLVLEGGLTEMSLHVDITQRGRLGYGHAAAEEDLMPLREELAGMVRRVRRTTGALLRAATTLTIFRGNLDSVPHVIDWCLRNRDVFGLVSFQPVAMVGRTRETLAGVGSGELWERIGAALAPFGCEEAPRRLYFGHPDCTRIEPLIVYERRGRPARLLPILREGNDEDDAIMRGFLARGLGGIAFRDDTTSQSLCRAAGALATDPAWFLGPVRRWIARRTAAMGTSTLGLVSSLLAGRASLNGFTIVSHHFMSSAELATPLGRERTASCVFRVPVDGRMVPMCEVNAGGIREKVYAHATVAAGPSALVALGEAAPPMAELPCR